MNIDNGSMNFSASIDYQQLVDAVKDIQKRLGGLEGTVTQAGESLDKLGGGFKELLGVIGGTAAITGFVKQMFSVRSSFQDTQAAMEVFLGSSEKAEEHMKELQKYAWFNMFDFSTLTQASSQLQAFGTDVDDVIPLIDRLSNIAAGTKTDLMELVASFNRAKSIGTADSRLLMSFATKGLDVVTTLREIGVAVDGSSVSFEQLMMAVEAATNEGGRFYNLMDAQFNNLSSLAGAVEDDISIMFNEIGEKLQPTMEAALKFTHTLIDNYETIGRVLAVLLTTYGAYRTALIAATVAENLKAVGVKSLTGAEKIHYTWLVITEKAQRLLNKTMLANPYVLLATVIIGATAALIAHSKAVNSEKGIEERLNGELEKRLELHKELIDESSQYINTLFDEKSSADSLRESYEKLRKLKPFENMSIGEIKKLGIDKVKEIVEDFDVSEQIDIETKKIANRINEYNRLISSAKGEFGTGSVLGKANAKKYTRKADSELEVIMSSNESLVNLQISSFEKLDNEQKKLKYNEFINSLTEVNSTLDENDIRFKINRQSIELFKKELESIENPKIETVELKSVVNDIVDARNKLNQLRSEISEGGLFDNVNSSKDIKAAEDNLKALLSLYKTLTGREYDKEKEATRKYQREAEDARLEIIADSYERQAKQTSVAANRQIEDLKRTLEEETTLTEAQKKALSDKIKSIEEKRNKDHADIENAHIAQIIKTRKGLDELEYEDAKKVLEYEREKTNAKLGLMDDGFMKESAMLESEHLSRLEEIKRQNKEELDLYEENAKKRYLLENQDKNENDFYAQWTGVPQDEKGKIDNKAKERTDAENASFVKSNAELLSKLLSDYGDYTAKKLAIDKKYDDEVAFLDGKRINAASQDEQEALANAISRSKKIKAKATLELEVANINTKPYENVEERIKAINDAYEVYIESLREAGATESEILDAENEKVENAGELATLYARQAELEKKLNVAYENNDIDNIKKYKKELGEVTTQIDKMTQMSPGEAFIEGFEQNKMQMLLDVTQQLVASFQQLAEASGSVNAKDASGFLSSVSKGLQGFQQGGFVGLLMAGIEDTISQITDAILSAKRLESAISAAKLESWKGDMQKLLDTDAGIFGDDEIANVNAAVSVLDSAKDKMAGLSTATQDLGVGFSDFLAMTNLFNWKVANTLTTGAEYTSAAMKTWEEALEKGYNNIESFVLTKNDKGWLVNFFGVEDEFISLKDAAAELGYELYDVYGNLNADALQAILDTYEDLSDEQRKWLEQGIAYSEQYAEAMESISSYLQDLFGGVAGDISDKMIEAFLESGDAAADFGDVVSDVGKNMAKDLLKNLILSTYFTSLEEDFKKKIASDGMNPDTAAYIMTATNDAMSRLEADLPQWTGLLQQWQTILGDSAGDAESIGGGTALASASQESIDMMNGQLNAMRNVQSSIDNKISSILISLSGIDTHIQDGFDRSNKNLEKIADNTSERGSLARAFGFYNN